MKKIILSMGSLLASSSAWADVIIKHKNKVHYEQEFVLPLICCLALVAVNFGVVLYLRRKSK